MTRQADGTLASELGRDDIDAMLGAAEPRRIEALSASLKSGGRYLLCLA